VHELGIAQSIVDKVLAKMTAEGYPEIVAIGLRIGALTDVVPDALTFGFESSVVGTPLARTRLAIETVPVAGVCETCGRTCAVEEFLFVCPHCGSRDIRMTQGDELEIAYIEIPEPSPEIPGDKKPGGRESCRPAPQE